ncbi:glycosyltransferase [Candidatus Peregrinibacteria bacterium]|nr:glycosyltransferase [Candidatus Peregrinibacteria bacterium]
MKVLNVNPLIDVSTGGGAAERTVKMSYFLAKHNVETSILTLDVNISQELKEKLKNVSILALPCLFARFFIPVPLIFKVAKLIKSVDLIHLMNHWTILNVWVYLLARFYKKPYVVCPAGALRVYGRSKKIKGLFNSIIGKSIINNADYCIVVTEDEKEHFYEHGIDDKKIILIPNGVSEDEVPKLDRKHFLKEKNLKDEKFIFYIGRLNSIKGTDLLVEAFCKSKEHIKNYHLLIAGPDEGLLAQLKEKVSEYSLDDKVHFLGFLSKDDKYQAYHCADFLTIPSRSEAMSIVVLESGLVGTPVLLTDQCGLNELEDLKCGKVVAAEVNDLAKGLQYLIKNEEKLPEMGKNLEAFVRNNYAWDSIVEQYIHHYKKLT